MRQEVNNDRERIEEMYQDIGTSSGLEFEIIQDRDDLDLQIIFEKQNGLAFKVIGYLFGDTLHLNAGELWYEVFPSTDESIRKKYREALIGIISGELRITQYYRNGEPVKAKLEKPSKGKWETLFTWHKFHIPWPWQERTVNEIQNA